MSESDCSSTSGRGKKKKSITANDQKNKRKIPRCTSPSHFVLEPQEALKYGPEFLLSLPDRARVDELLSSVSNMYYKPNTKHQRVDDGAFIVRCDAEAESYPTIDMLVSPLRNPHILDTWSPKEIALFEAGICSFGKEFHEIQKLIKTKTTKEIVEFYYQWKISAHYQMWKAYGRPNQNIPNARLERWKVLEDKFNEKR